MTYFELFCLIFYALDSNYTINSNEEIQQFLSDANPFLFEDIGSADPAVFEEFCSFIKLPITPADSYSIAQKYIEHLNISELNKVFASISKSDWNEGLASYMASPHKK